MKSLLFFTMMMFAVSAFAAEVADGESEGGSNDIEKCFKCKKNDEDGLKSAQKKQAQERVREVYANQQTPVDGDPNAVKENKDK